MDQGTFDQEDYPLRWKEEQSLASLLTALNERAQTSSSITMPGDALLKDVSLEVATRAARRLAALFEAQVKHVARLMDASLCALYLTEPARTVPLDEARRRSRLDGRANDAPEAKRLALRALYGAAWNGEATRRGIPLPAGGPATQTLFDQSPLLSTEADLPALREAGRARLVHCWLYVPLFGLAAPAPQPQSRETRPLGALLQAPGDRIETPRVVLGVLAVGRSTPGDTFTPEDIRLLSILGEQLVLALENARLSEQVNLARALGRRSQAVLEHVAERERVIEELNEGVLLLAPNGQILQINRLGCELLGWSKNSGPLGRVQDMDAIQLRGTTDDPLPIEDWPMFRALRGQQLDQEALYYLGPDRQERLLVFSGRPLWDAQGRLERALINFHEASSEQIVRAQLEQMLRMSELRAHYVGSVLEAMTDGTIICNRKGMVLLVNPSGMRLLGIEDKQIKTGQYHLTQFISDFNVRTLDGKLLALENFPLLSALRGETVRDIELTMRRPGSNHDWRAQVSAAPIKERAQSAPIVGAVAVLVDVTEARALERAKDEFLALSAHELKGPLTLIRGFAQFLRRSTKRAPQGVERRADMQQWVEKVETQTTRLGRLIDELTDAARADLGKFDLNLRPVPLGALLRHIAEAQQFTTERHQISVDAPAEGLFVSGDETRLEQVFDNLVANAIKYSPAGGPITISVTNVDTQESPAFVEVAVRDQGLGISPSDLERIFDRFTRTETVRRSKTQGLGLGLYIARGIIQAHGGSLRATSEGLGKGSTFIVRLHRTTVA